MMLAMMTAAKVSDGPVCHELSVMSGGWEGTVVYVHPSGCPSYLLAAPSVSGKFRMAEGDAAASVGWSGVVRSPLLRAGTVQVVVASPWTPHREVRLETHRSLILAFRSCPFVRVIVGNVGDGSLNGSLGGNYKPGGGGIR